MSDMSAIVPQCRLASAIDVAGSALADEELAFIDNADAGGVYLLQFAHDHWNRYDETKAWTPAMEDYRATLRARRDHYAAQAWPIDRSAGNYRSQYPWITARGD